MFNLFFITTADGVCVIFTVSFEQTRDVKGLSGNKLCQGNSTRWGSWALESFILSCPFLYYFALTPLLPFTLCPTSLPLVLCTPPGFSQHLPLNSTPSILQCNNLCLSTNIIVPKPPAKLGLVSHCFHLLISSKKRQKGWVEFVFEVSHAPTYILYLSPPFCIFWKRLLWLNWINSSLRYLIFSQLVGIIKHHCLRKTPFLKKNKLNSKMLARYLGDKQFTYVNSPPAANVQRHRGAPRFPSGLAGFPQFF